MGFLGKVLQPFFCEKMFGVSKPMDVDENLTDLPELDNEDSERLRIFVQHLNNFKPYPVNVSIVRDDSKSRMNFINHLVDDRAEASFSYYEFASFGNSNKVITFQVLRLSQVLTKIIKYLLLVGRMFV